MLERQPGVLLVEDDHASVVAGSAVREHDRLRVAALGGDPGDVEDPATPTCGVAIMAGDETTVARVEGRQALGPRWVSHILQATTAELLQRPRASTPICSPRPSRLRRPPRSADRALQERGVAAHGARA